MPQSWPTRSKPLNPHISVITHPSPLNLPITSASTGGGRLLFSNIDARLGFSGRVLCSVDQALLNIPHVALVADQDLVDAIARVLLNVREPVSHIYSYERSRRE
ncbi:hypothetical protein BC937DRAFT_93323 [Endogone sp. FLAS-F59071]|nr:hypothetical protein BC937DRAFT_93323 [Endogone sp. FLAS-F59071]|eukprot:RUS23379.1 hypothetical protein BC937DRAFT_93323 [Endogone sp. FLAS-F59071]